MNLREKVDGRLRPARRRAAVVLRDVAHRMEPPPPRWRLRQIVGGKFDDIGRQQYEFMVAEGLQPQHRFIEIGCGILRGGRHYVRHVDVGNYHGIDISDNMIDGARKELADLGLEDRQAQLKVTDEFDIDFGVGFDMGIAVSVFTHVPYNSCYLAFAQLSKHLAPGGRFYATYFPCPDGPERFTPIVQEFNPPAKNPVTTYGDRNPYHYSTEDFERMARQCGLHLDIIGDWGHLRGQHMLRVTKPA